MWLLRSAEAPSIPRLLIVPALAGVVIAIIVKRLAPDLRGNGVNQTKTAVYISDGDIPFHTVYRKFFCSALAIGAGHSLGPEDPSLQIGAGIASLIGRKLRLSRENLRLIAPVGAAAGLAAAFNAPIAAVIFVIEEVVGRWNSGILGAVVLSAVSSVVVMRGFLGAEPLFRVPQFRLQHPLELLGYAVLLTLAPSEGGTSYIFCARYQAGVPLGRIPLGKVKSANSNIATATPIATAHAVMVGIAF